MGDSSQCLQRRFQGICFGTSERPRFAVLDDYPSVTDNLEASSAERYRVPALSKIVWFPEGDAPPDLSVGPLQLIAKPGKVRMVHDGSKPKYGLKGALANRKVNFGKKDRFRPLLRPGAFMAGLYLPDCILRCSVSPPGRRLLGVSCCASGRLGVYLFLPFGLIPPPGWSDRCVKEVLRVAKRA